LEAKARGSRQCIVRKVHADGARQTVKMYCLGAWKPLEAGSGAVRRGAAPDPLPLASFVLAYPVQSAMCCRPVHRGVLCVLRGIGVWGTQQDHELRNRRSQARLTRLMTNGRSSTWELGGAGGAPARGSCSCARRAGTPKPAAERRVRSGGGKSPRRERRKREGGGLPAGTGPDPRSAGRWPLAVDTGYWIQSLQFAVFRVPCSRPRPPAPIRGGLRSDAGSS
jgi:hypothetical protein